MELSSTLTKFNYCGSSVCLFPEEERFQGLFQPITATRAPKFVNVSNFAKGRNICHRTRIKLQYCNESNKNVYGKLPKHNYQLISRLKLITPRWMQKGNIRGVLFGLCYLVVTILCNNFLVRIPYTKRAHFLLSSSSMADGLRGESYYKNNVERKYEGRILPPTHPACVGAESVLRGIVRALNYGLKLEPDEFMTVSGHLPEEVEDQHMPKDDLDSNHDDQGLFITANFGNDAEGKPRGGELCPQNEIISNCPPREDMFRNLNLVYGKLHLERLDWKLTIVDPDEVEAFHVRDTGRIILAKNFLVNYCNSEANIAAVLGHEVGHVVSPDCVYHVWKLFFVSMFSLRAQPNLFDSIAYSVLCYIYLKWYGRRMELVADYIGIMVMAAAGYDPRTRIEKMSADIYRSYNHEFGGKRVVKYCVKKMGEVIDHLFLETHPSDETRLKVLQVVMENAVAIYDQVRARGGGGGA